MLDVVGLSRSAQLRGGDPGFEAIATLTSSPRTKGPAYVVFVLSQSMDLFMDKSALSLVKPLSLWPRSCKSTLGDVIIRSCLCVQLLSHLSIPDANFESMKVKAKIGYMGMLQDGKPPSPSLSPSLSHYPLSPPLQS